MERKGMEIKGKETGIYANNMKERPRDLVSFQIIVS